MTPSRPIRRPIRRRPAEFQPGGLVPDYKDVERLRRYITSNGKIIPARRTGLSAQMQRRLATAIKRARHMALLPFASSEYRERGGGRR